MAIAEGEAEMDVLLGFPNARLLVPKRVVVGFVDGMLNLALSGCFLDSKTQVRDLSG